jgi:hypothetical protein
MKAFAWVLALLSLAPPAVRAADAPSASPGDACLMLNNRILGPRTQNRPLPLMRGDSEHGFTPACSVTWSAISPKNEPIPVEDCFRGSLLQLPNDSACGVGTGRLWIGARWVMTTADLLRTKERTAVCQQLETGAWAGTRAFSFDCKPRSGALAASKASDKAIKTDSSALPSTPPSPPR